MTAYYNEIDPYAAQWLRNLVSTGHIAPGDVDERSIAEVTPDDLGGYDQHHFFAGIGGWSVALRLAGWPDERPVWTGSCPCQPISAAGKRNGFDDERHLWPEWFRLVREFRPRLVVGEQVASPSGLAWLDLVQADMEGEDYAVGAFDLCAAGVGAPHIRQRLWFVALSDGWHSGPEREQRGREQRQQPQDGGVGELADAEGRGQREFRDAAQSGCGGHADGGFWSDLEWLSCTDGKARPTQPGLFPLAHGVQRRTSKLRAYGNAIVPPVAAEFVAAVMEVVDGR